MKKEVLIFITDNYADWEIGFIAPLLNNPSRDHIVRTVALERRSVLSQGGLTVIPDYAIDFLPEPFEMIILTGGTYWSEKSYIIPRLNKVINRCIEKGSAVAAICDGATFLAENGYLNSIPHTGNSLEHLKISAPNYKGEAFFQEKQCVVHDKIITANGTSTLEFSRDILTLLDVELPMGVTEWYSYYKNGAFNTT